ncbi:hypothetical protein [Cohnella mopanensis]|uniref:hypothetical protein n=1 Tax=Cohnella mopanensis TaxID=2911966 RepID=UPI001EF9AA41|nr:hypothetical protein [Cohnella mopanensis]
MIVERGFAHRKLMKQTKNWLEPGEYFPNNICSNENNVIDIYTLNRGCLFIMFVNTDCEPCGDALNTLYQILTERRLPFVILVATRETEKLNTIREAFDDRATVYGCSQMEMKKHFLTDATPWCYGINSVGQIVTSSVAGNRAEMAKLLAPFRSLIGEMR